MTCEFEHAKSLSTVAVLLCVFNRGRFGINTCSS